ncbi:MAG: GxxExxY protein [Verrucomicrobiota bacterium]
MNHRDAEAQRKTLNELSKRVIGLCIEVHRVLGPGLLESAYEAALAHELSRAGIPFQKQVDLPLDYKGVKLDCGYRLDFIIANELIVELKAVQEILPVHKAQLLTYLKLNQNLLGLLINFNVPLLKDGIERVVLGGVFK